MDYKLIKENFERATAKLTEEAAEFTEEEKKALGFLQVTINAFRGSDGFASDVLEPLDTSRNDKVMEINTLAEQLVQELQELEKKIDMLVGDEPEEADYDTETGEFIGEEKKQYPGLVKGSNLSYIGAGIEKAGKTAADYIFVRGSMGFYAFPKDGEFPEYLRSKVINTPSAEVLNRRQTRPPSTYHKD